MIIVVGLDGPKKMQVAKSLVAEDPTLSIVDANMYRRSESGVKRSYDQYHESLIKVLDENSVFVSTYLDYSDSDMRSQRLVNFLIGNRKPTRLIIVDQDMNSLVASIVDRSIRRAKGEEQQGGACEKETSESRAKLLIKAIQSYDDAVYEIKSLEKYANHYGISNIEVQIHKL